MAELVPIPSPGVPLYFGEEGSPLVIVVHDWYGRLPGLDSYAKALVKVGFRVVVPDLYAGVATVDATDAEQLMQQLDVAGSLAILDDVIQSAREQGSKKIGVVGFSMGGWLTLLHAQGGAVDAAVAYYATLSAAQHGVIPCPLQLHFAETDDWGADDYPELFISRLKDHGTPVSDYSYIGTVHTFANASIPEKFDAPESALAFARTATFLEDHLSD
jgi:carboxymethylenebutenolidase